jgi:hypothetical protein
MEKIVTTLYPIIVVFILFLIIGLIAFGAIVTDNAEQPMSFIMCANSFWMVFCSCLYFISNKKPLDKSDLI